MYCHGLVGAGIFVGKRASRCCCQHVSGNTVVGDGDRGGGVAVIGFACGSVAQRQFALRNGSAGGASGRTQHIVGGIGAGQAGILYRYSLVHASILVGKRTRSCCRQHVAGNTVVSDGDRGGSVAVISFTGGSEAQRQCTLRNGGAGGTGGRAQHIVASIGAGQAGALHGNGFDRSGVLVGEDCVRRCCQHVVRDAVIGQYHSRRNAAVIRFIDASKTEIERARRDGGAGLAFGSGQYIVARIVATQVVARHAVVHVLGDAHVLVGETCREVRQLDLVGADHTVQAAAEAGAGAAVIDFIGCAHAAQDQCGAADVGGAAGGFCQAVVAQAVAGQDQAADIDRLAGAGALVDKLRGAGHAERIAGHRIAECQSGVAETELAVVDLAAADGHAQRARHDRQCRRARQGDVVFGRPQAAQGIAADIARRVVAGAAAGGAVAVEQSAVSQRAGERRQLAVVDAAGRTAGGHLQRRQESFQHRRGVAVVNAPYRAFAEIEAAELRLLLHLQRRTSG